MSTAPHTSSNPVPLLIAGIAGVAGLNALNWFRARYGDQVIGQRPARNWPLRGPGILGWDLEDVAATRQLLIDKGIRAVLN
ncbi:MAG: dTDP-4-dehydrorhamnose reductase, partial [Planctomycetota bacterium]